MQYMLIHVGEQDGEQGGEQRDEAQHGPAGPTEDRRPGAEVSTELADWLEEAIEQRVNLQGSRLRPIGEATTVRARGGEVLVTDGPFVETKEQVGGYDLLECGSLEEAIGWARRHPTVTGGGAIEVRPLRVPGEVPNCGPLPPLAVGAMRYLFMVTADEGVQLTEEESARVGPATDAWVAEMNGRGVRLCGNQLERVDQARTVRSTGGHVLVTDGPFAETKEQIAGFDVIDCADLDEAIEVASKHPVTSFGIGAIEVRPFWVWDES